MSRLVVVMVALLLGAAPCLAQAPGSGPGPLVKYGKWLLAAGALGMNYLAAQAHDRAEESFNTLERRCNDDHTLCNLDIQGRYSDDESEALYQQYLPTGAQRSTLQTSSWGTKGFWLCDPFRNILIFEENIPAEESDTQQGA